MANTKIPAELSSTPSISDSGDATAITITSAEKVMIGSGTSNAIADSITGVQISGSSFSGMLSVSRHENNAFGAAVMLGKSRNGTVGSNTIIQDDDIIASISFHADDGTNLDSKVASIEAAVDGSPAANDTPGRLTFSTTADGSAAVTERMRITSSGRVGIGTTSPDVTFEIADTNAYMHIDATNHAAVFIDRASTSYHNNVFYQTADTTNWRIGQMGADDILQVRDEVNDNSNVMVWKHGGNVGIGTSSPTSYGNSQKTLVIEDSTSPAIAWSDTGQTRDWFAVAQGSGLYFNYGDGGGSGSASNVTSVLLLDNGGNVAIRTTDTTAALTVSQVNNDDPVARFDIACGALNAIVGMQLRVTAGAANAANKFFIQGLDDTSTERFRFNTNGSGSMSGSLTQNSSDERLKEEITTIENPLEKLKTLRGVNFTWKDKTPVGDLDLPNPNTKDVGVIAQEVQSVLPEAVELAPLDTEYDENGNKVSKTGENYLTVFEEKIVPLLIESIKEQQTIIEDLKARIETLEG